MTSYMRKSISMGVYDPNDIRQNFAQWYPDWAATNTTYVRFFIKWDKIAPYGPNNPGTDTSLMPGSSFQIRQYIQGLDYQIAIARAMGLKVVLVFESFPQWANGVADARVPPADLSPTSWWATYLNWVYLRWNPVSAQAAGNAAWADFLEICNEPNGYRGFPSAPEPHYVAGRMMMSAQAMQDATPLPAPILAGPALSDNAQATTFQNNLLGYLRANGFRAATSAGNTMFAWTHHCYRDVELYSGNMIGARAQRDRLASFGWRGWPFADPSNPYLLLTEGGARFANVPQWDQGPRTAAAYNQLHNDSATGGRGIAMFTNYLDVTDSQDSGNCGIRGWCPPHDPLPLFPTWAALPAP